MVYLPSLTTSYSAGINPANHIHMSSEATPIDTPILSPRNSSPNLPTLPSFSLERSPGELKHIWRGDDRDWARCHGALHSLGRDGRKLELWKYWINPNGKSVARRQAIWTGEPSNFIDEDGAAEVYELLADAPFDVDTTRAPVEFLRPVLEAHVSRSLRISALSNHICVSQAQEILSLFIFPDSRACFMDMLINAGLVDSMPASAGLGDFWSRRKASGESPRLHDTS
jgi:hypothetical protein